MILYKGVNKDDSVYRSYFDPGVTYELNKQYRKDFELTEHQHDGFYFDNLDNARRWARRCDNGVVLACEVKDEDIYSASYLKDPKWATCGIVRARGFVPLREVEVDLYNPW